MKLHWSVRWAKREQALQALRLAGEAMEAADKVGDLSRDFRVGLLMKARAHARSAADLLSQTEGWRER